MDGREGTWAGVRERVLALRTAPGADEVFGAARPEGAGHGFVLAPPLSAAEVEEWETAHAVVLPGEFRSFLLEVGASGAGPHYGLFGLSGLDRAWSDAPGAHVRYPFTPGPAMAELTAYEAEAEPRRADHPDEAAYRRAWTRYNERYEELEDRLDRGTLPLNHQGCGYYTLLAVTGPERGTLWDDVRAVGEGVVPLRHSGEDGDRLGFATWYLRWLDRAERQAGAV